MVSDSRQLPYPPIADEDQTATEMVRAWIANQDLHCALNVGLWHRDNKIDERQAWGVLLADLARHVANALEDALRLDPCESLKMIVQSMNAELRSASGEAAE